MKNYKYSFPKVLGLKALLNISVNQNEFMNTKDWILCIECFLNFTVSEKKMQRKELDEF